MSGALNLGQVAGIKIRIHWTFLLLIGWIVVVHARMGYNFQQILLVTGFVMAVFACVVLHELGHALTAKRFNIQTQDITLLPIGGLAKLERMPEIPKQELLISMAGPLVNVVIAGVLFLITRDFPSNIELGTITPENFLVNLMGINIMLVAFNLIPAFPMDGGRIFRALLSLRINRAKATQIASSAGQIIAVIFVFFGFFYNPFLIFIGLFVYLGAQVENEQIQTMAMLSDYKVKDIMMENVSLLQERDLLGKAVETLLKGQENEFLVVDNNGGVSGILTKNDIIQGLTLKGKNIAVSEVMQKDFKTLDPDMLVKDVYTIMRQKSYTLLPVMIDGQLSGSIDLENILEFVMVQNALQKEKISK